MHCGAHCEINLAGAYFVFVFENGEHIKNGGHIENAEYFLFDLISVSGTSLV